MIGGLSPVIVFTFPDSNLLGFIGLPTVIPIYLSESVTGVMSDNAEEAIKIETQVYKNLAYQRKVNQSVTLRFRVIKDNVVASTLISLMSKIYELVNSTNPQNQALIKGENEQLTGYYITIYYDSTFMFKGYLADYRKTTIGETNQYEISATFVTVPKEPKVAAIVDKVTNKITLLPRG